METALSVELNDWKFNEDYQGSTYIHDTNGDKIFELVKVQLASGGIMSVSTDFVDFTDAGVLIGINTYDDVDYDFTDAKLLDLNFEICHYSNSKLVDDGFWKGNIENVVWLDSKDE